MENNDKIKLLLQTIEAIDDVTITETDQDKNDISDEDIEYMESWATADYKKELFSLLGQKVYVEYKNNGVLPV